MNDIESENFNAEEYLDALLKSQKFDLCIAKYSFLL